MAGKITAIGLVGCGYMGNYYAHNISGDNNAAIMQACDPSPEKLSAFCDKWHISEKTTDWHDLFKNKNLDGIICCTNDSLHNLIFNECVSHSCPLLLEKPPALKLADIENHLKKRSDIFDSFEFRINFSKRVLPAVAAAQKFIAAGGIGEITGIELHYRQGWLVNEDFGSWKEKNAWFWRLTSHYSHYGVLGDLGSHLFDLAVLFCGEPSSVFCSLQTHVKSPSELKGRKLDSPDDARCIINFKNGVSGLLNVTRSAAGEKDEIYILLSGSKGSVRISAAELKKGFHLFLKGNDDWEFISADEKPLKIYEDFVSDSKSRDSNFPGIRDAVINQVLIDSAVESSRTGRLVPLNEYISGFENLSVFWNSLWEDN